MVAPDFLVNNLRWKLIALLLALLLWFVIKFSIYKEITGGRNQVLRHQPIMVLKAPDDSRVFRIEPPHVDVVVRSTKELSGDAVEVFLDLSKLPDVNSSFKQVLVRAADTIQVVRTEPSFILVERASAADSPSAMTPSKP